VFSGKPGQCVFQGLTMFDQAMWSPKSCVTCLCTGGQVVCEEVSCPTTRCYFPSTPVGECCPVCMETGKEASGSPAHDPSPPHQAASDSPQHVTEGGGASVSFITSACKNAVLPSSKRSSQLCDPSDPREDLQGGRGAVEEEERSLRRNLQALIEDEEKQLQEELRERLEEVDEWMEKVLRGDVLNLPPKPEEPEEPEPSHARPPGCLLSDVTLTCETLALAYFPPLSIPQLKALSLEDNNISSVPAESFNGIPDLEWINLSKNQLGSAAIHHKAFTGLKFLRRLYLNGNLLEVVPNNLPSTLQELKISENKLRGVDENSFRGLENLVILELEGNLLSESNVDPRAFAPLSQLSYLRLGRNYFRMVPQGLPPSLLELYLESNRIEEISEGVFNQTQNLNVVSLSHNRLDETRIAPMAWLNHRNLESIDLSHNQLFLVPSHLPRSLVNLLLVGNNIERIPGFVFAHMDPGLEYLYLSYNNLDQDGIEPESFLGVHGSMVELSLDHNQLLTVPPGINEMTGLHFLRLNNNQIRSVPEESICDPDREGDPNLVVLRLENNYIDSKKISPSAFSCVHAPSSVILKPQKTK
uniref:Extracellular matrix protein 2 n=1 Tax=Tetraodon nigroviridis TaxID=99883 RepID=H3CAF2_TETNG